MPHSITSKRCVVEARLRCLCKGLGLGKKSERKSGRKSERKSERMLPYQREKRLISLDSCCAYCTPLIQTLRRRAKRVSEKYFMGGHQWLPTTQSLSVCLSVCPTLRFDFRAILFGLSCRTYPTLVSKSGCTNWKKCIL
jgi:hypothetical protein